MSSKSIDGVIKSVIAGYQIIPQFYEVSAKSLLLSLYCLVLFAQSADGQFTVKPRPIVGAEVNFRSFHGDVLRSPLSDASVFFGANAGITSGRFDAIVRYSAGRLTSATRVLPEPSNFSAQLKLIDLSIRYHPLKGNDLSPFVQAGIGNTWFSSYTNLKDRLGNPYYYWSDGSIRNMPESEYNAISATPIVMDNTFETPLAIEQRSIYIPLLAGLEMPIGNSLRFSIAAEFLLLQSDNMDRNTNTQAWDQIRGVNASVSWSPDLRKRNQRAAKPKKPTSLLPPPDYSNVDFKELLNTDEDGDGVNDLKDLCYGTPKGYPVDEHGCPADRDGDGIPDAGDAEPDTPPGLPVHSNGVAMSDEEIQQQYNDSISFHVKVLRRIHKPSRPYPVRKHIPESNYRKYLELLEEHPEWRQSEILTPRELPAELRAIDTNRDLILSLRELEEAAHKLFDGTLPELNPEILRQAIRYAFENP